MAEAGIPQYRDTPPTVTGNTSDTDPGSRYDSGGGGDGSEQSSTGSGSNADGSSKDGEEGSGAAGGGNDGDKGGAAGNKAGGDKAGVGDAARLGADPLGASASDDGSSPLVPILIALAVLAAISVGVVAMRKKREDAGPGASASPEAG